MKNAKIGIAGCGGIGSNVALNLIRLGVTNILLVDFDIIEESNLNRQFYFYNQIGMLKTAMLKLNLLSIKPDLNIERNDIKLNKSNIKRVFKDCDIVIEGFDSTTDKKMLIEELSYFKTIFASSGLGNKWDVDNIISRKLSNTLFISGDFESDTNEGILPYSPGVTITAGKISAQVLKYLTENKKSFNLPQVYGITYSRASLGRTNIEVVHEMIKAGIKLIQYREKDLSQKEMLKECFKIREITRDAGVMFIVNDYITIAQLVDADGVHIGQDDYPIRTVRKILGPDKIIGLSTHSPEQGIKAVEDGADYIGVGPIHATMTKENVCAPVGYEYLDWVVENLDIPFVAIGGIKVNNLDEIVKRGAESVALVSEITTSRDISAKTEEIRRVFNGI